jgi:peptide/nickel transport system substrate-binding protein
LTPVLPATDDWFPMAISRQRRPRPIETMLAVTLLVSATLTLAATLLGAGAASGADTPKRGGVLRIGTVGEPPTLDAHWTTVAITDVITNHVYEGLFTLDEDRRPIPMLAEGYTVSRDGLTYTFKLRQGVRFHNGKEMSAEDVVASLKRWGQQSIYGKSLFAQIAELRGVERHTVELRLKEPSAIVVISLAVANNAAVIYPKEIAEKFPPQTKATEFVGTGPFKVAEWKPDQYIRMVRFDDYRPRAERPNGYGGSKTAWVDEIRWVPVPDVASRVAQVETGALDFADDLNLDAYDRLRTSASVRALIAKPYFWLVAVLNKKEGLMTSQKLRQAWQAAIDIEPIMRNVAGGHPEFYRMDSSLAHTEVSAWHTKLAGLPWNERNKDKAKRLLRDAGYKGEPIRFMTTQEYKWMYDFALLTKQQLEDIGFTIDLQVVDWSTLAQRRNNSKAYDAFTTGIGPFYDPTHAVVLSCNWPGWTCDEEITKLQADLTRETDPKKRYALWEQQTRLFYEKVPVIRYGDLHGLKAMRKTVKGFNEKTDRPRFTNVWLEK